MHVRIITSPMMNPPESSIIQETKKRSRSRSPPPWHRPAKQSRNSGHSRGPNGTISHSSHDGDVQDRRKQESFVREQTRLNLIQEAEQMREWVSKEDEFVLKQSKKKAQIRVKEGRAKPIDWLAVVLSIIDLTKDPLEDDTMDSELDVVDPEGVIEDLDHAQLQELEKDVATYLVLESNVKNRAFWNVRRCNI